MADLRFSDLRKVFDNDVVALEAFSLDVPSPTLVVLVGPSGCGKTTLLRLIAGLESPSSGTIHLGDERLDDREPKERDVAMVFQNYALYPHMTVRDNLSFGLRIRKTDKKVIAKKVTEVAKSLEIDSLLDRKPGQLSGGQRQRVALGRAIIREPRVFLFDEPLSNLDARLRDEMRYLIKRLYQRHRITSLYVTHDQVEAMTIGEMLVIMRDGRIHQTGSPSECYERPSDTFVASFLGSPPMNFLEGRYESGYGVVHLGNLSRFRLPKPIAAVLDQSGETELVIGARPEDINAKSAREPSTGDVLALSGTVVLNEPLGHEVLTHMSIDSKPVIMRSQSLQSATGEVSVWVDPGRLHFFSKKTKQRIDTPRFRL